MFSGGVFSDRGEKTYDGTVFDGPLRPRKMMRMLNTSLRAGCATFRQTCLLRTFTRLTNKVICSSKSTNLIISLPDR